MERCVIQQMERIQSRSKTRWHFHVQDRGVSFCCLPKRSRKTISMGEMHEVSKTQKHRKKCKGIQLATRVKLWTSRPVRMNHKHAQGENIDGDEAYIVRMSKIEECGERTEMTQN